MYRLYSYIEIYWIESIVICSRDIYICVYIYTNMYIYIHVYAYVHMLRGTSHIIIYDSANDPMLLLNSPFSVVRYPMLATKTSKTRQTPTAPGCGSGGLWCRLSLRSWWGHLAWPASIAPSDIIEGEHIYCHNVLFSDSHSIIDLKL